MKRMNLLGIVICLLFCILLLPGCHRDHRDVAHIKIIIDPNQLEGETIVREVYSADSIATFMDMLDDKSTTPVKFYPRCAIEIYRSASIERYLGSAQYVKDAKGRTYEVHSRSWLSWISR